MLAGISVERAGPLSGTRGEQIAGRFSMVRTGSFPLDGQWATLIAAIQAVIDGTEQVTRKAMDAIPVDIASQAGQHTGRPAT